MWYLSSCFVIELIKGSVMLLKRRRSGLFLESLHCPSRAISVALFCASFFSALMAFSAALTPEEVQKFQDDLGIVLTTSQQTEIAEIVKPTGEWPAWRSNAVERIEQNRKADLQLQVVDKAGLPVPDALIHIQQKNSSFRFGGILNLYNWFDNKDGYRDIIQKLFNSLGTQNALKPKITNKHGLLPPFFEWAETNNIPVRGHLLIWPGSGSLPYRSPYEVQQALDELRDTQSQTNPPPSDAEIATLKSNLIDVVDFQITDWASKWPVYEWDVINEPLEKRDIQNALDDYGQMARWFKMADTNKVKANCKLAINEYQIISAKWWKPPSNGWSFESRTARYQTEIDRVIADGGRVDLIGFQSRFKYGHMDPALVSDRLAFYENAYPNIKLVGTEFEILNSGAISNEFNRAQMTEEILTTYFSHPQVTGLNVWTFRSSVDNAMCDISGNLKLNALVWYYLHRIRFATDKTQETNLDGTTAIRAFKGDYQIKIEFNGKTYLSNLTLTNAQSATLVLDDLSISGHRYAKWLEQHPSMGALSNRLDDADGDGVLNLAEYATGSSPDDPASLPSSIKFSVSNRQVRCVFPRRTDAASRGLRYWLETSTNLFDSSSWNSNGIVETGCGAVSNHFESVTNSIPMGEAGQVFIRLRTKYR